MTKNYDTYFKEKNKVFEYLNFANKHLKNIEFVKEIIGNLIICK